MIGYPISKEVLDQRIEDFKAGWLQRASDRTGEDISEKAIERMTASPHRHANCLRSFKSLYETDPDEAKDIYEKVVRLLETGSQ